MSRLVALLTDFGLVDTYVGVMKGVMLTIKPDLQLVDITHNIQPQNVRQAAFALLNAYLFFPPGTVFLVIVDPGVGSERKPLAAQVGSYVFVAPDNGILSYVLDEQPEARLVELSNVSYRLPRVSETFHGRDVFAPAAAHLAAGVPLENFGEPINEPVLLPDPELHVMGRRIAGEIVHIDHFGNVITSVGRLRWVGPERLSLLPRTGDSGAPVPVSSVDAVVMLAGQTIGGIVRHYSETARGALLATVGSSGYLEVAVNQGNCSERLDVSVGDPVSLYLDGMP